MIQDQSITVALVDDDAITCELISENLNGNGLKIITIQDPFSAIQKITDTSEISLAILDLDLGSSIDGPQLAREILKQRNIPILFFSAYIDKSYMEKIKNIESFGFVAKSSGTEVLAQSIHSALRLHHTISKLNESEAKFRVLVENSQELIWKCDIHGTITFLNQAWEKSLGYKVEEMLGKNFGDFQNSKPNTRDSIEFSKYLVGGSVKNYETIQIGKHGNENYFSFNAVPLLDPNGNVIGTQGTARDVTEKKASINEIIEKKNFAESIISSLPGIFYVINSENKFLQVNNKFLQVTQYTREEVMSMGPLDFFLEEEKKRITEKITEVFTSGESSVEAKFRIKSGDTIDYFFTGYRTNLNNSPALVGSGIDISHRVKAEKCLKESEAKFKNYIESSPYGIFILDRNGSYIDVNPAATQITGYSKEELCSMGFIQITPVEKLNSVTVFFEQLLINGSTQGEFPYIHKTGEIRFWSGKAVVINENLIIAYATDSTEIKKSRDALLKNEMQFRTLFENAIDGILLLSKDLQIQKFNDSFADMHGYSNSEMKNLTLQDLSVEDLSTTTPKMYEMIESKGEMFVDVRHYHKSGRILDIELSSYIIKLENESIFVAFLRDITEKKLAENKINTLLKDKELLLKEVHHRIKNNMNSVIGLLSLEEESIQEPLAKSALKDAQGMMYSMMVLYDKLYKSEEFTNLSIQDYINPLIDEILSIFPNRSIVNLEKEIEDKIIHSKILLSLGMILNETLTNTMKYAFKGRKSGNIKIQIYFPSETNGHLVVKDDGVGIPENVIQKKQEGFGLQLIEILSRQLDGNFSIQTMNGSIFKLEFSTLLKNS